jgi:hypothetical protein
MPSLARLVACHQSFCSVALVLGSLLAKEKGGALLVEWGWPLAFTLSCKSQVALVQAAGLAFLWLSCYCAYWIPAWDPFLILLIVLFCRRSISLAPPWVPMARRCWASSTSWPVARAARICSPTSSRQAWSACRSLCGNQSAVTKVLQLDRCLPATFRSGPSCPQRASSQAGALPSQALLQSADTQGLGHALLPLWCRLSRRCRPLTMVRSLIL